MKRILIMAVLASLMSFVFLPGYVHAARRRAYSAPKTYQVTGPVLELTGDMIVVQKGKERWEIARDAATKVTGDLIVGANVTILYRMKAASIDVKGEEAAAGAKPKATPKKP